MIGFPSVPEPSSLLWVEKLNRRAAALREECERLLRIDRSRSIESICQDAQSLHTDGDHQGCGVTLVHLSDICRAQGRLGPALRFSERAEQTFTGWPENRPKHNHAVTLYSLGLINQLLGSDKEAWDYYSEALDEFEEALEHWDSVIAAQPNASNGREECELILPWLEMLMEYVSRARALGGTSAIHAPIMIGCWPPGAQNPEVDKLLIDVTIKGLLVEMDVHLDNAVHKLELPAGAAGPITIQPGTAYHLLDAPPDLGNAFNDFQDARYVLVQAGMEANTLGVAKEVDDDEILYGEFTLDNNNEFRFTVAYPDANLPAPRIIGEDDLDPDSACKIISMFKAA